MENSVIVEGDNDIKLFPEDGELINILNIKRGIISALAVPVLEEERNKRMPTVFGLCKTDYTVNAREDIATDVTITRDLSRCDNFRPIKDHTSPLALITGMHYPLAQLFRSKQTCNYKFDNQQKHMTSGDCTETHLLVPFSHKGRYGVMNVGKQTVSLLGVTEHNERVFDYNEANMKPLHLDVSVDMSPNQDADAILTILRELAGLSQTTHGNKRAHLAQRLVAVIRKSNADTLSAALPEALDISRSLTYQALFQCGTPACSSAMLKVLRTIGSTTAEIDAAVYAMGLVPNPSRALVKEMLEMARFKPTKLIYYATSNAVRRLYKAEGRVTPEIEAVADYFTEETGDCTGDQEHIYLTLRVIGNMAAAVGAASPDLKSAVIKCINQPAASPKVQQAAIQVFRLTPVPEEGRSDLMQVLLNGNDPVQKRIAAYLILMKDPQPAELDQLAAALRNERNLQAKSFFISHITNILSSTAPETKELRQKILDALQGNEVEKVMDPTKFSRHYKIGSLVGNMIFEKANKLPKEVMLEMTLNAFGYDIDMFEVGVEGKGLEPTVEALFGPRGFFPDTAMKTIFFAMEKMPSQVNEVLSKIIPLKNHRKKRQASQNIIRDISQNVEKLIKDLKAQDTPEAMLYLRLLGAELGYLQIKDMEELAYSVAKVVENLLKMFPTDFIKGLFSSVDNELFLHYIFMDNEFYLPTGPGVPLRVALSGTFAPGVKGGLKIARDMSEIAFMPSVGVEFVAEIGAHLPDYVHSGLEMHTNIYHESGLSAKVALAHNQIKVTIPAPDGSSKLLSITNTLLSVAGDDINIVPAMEQRVNAHECRPLFSGLKQCSSIDFSDAWINDASPYFPLSGDSKYEIELRPTGEVSEYTATIKYTNEDMVDKVTVDVEAEGKTQNNSMMMFNRKDYTVSVQLLVPSLQADAKITTSLKYADDLTLEFESDLRLPETTSVQKLILTYDDEKIEADIKSDVSTGTKTIAAEFDNIKAQISDLLNQQIGQTEMKVLHVLTSAVEVNYTCIAIIVTLVYLNRETGANYHFGKDYYTITFPMPLGGKSSKDLNFPPALTTPNLAVPQLGLQISSIEVPLPEILVPETFTVSLPSLGMAEVSGKLSSNLYDLEATASAGRQSSEQRSYSASVEVIGTCPVDILSLRVQGSARLYETSSGTLKAEVKSAVYHKLIDASVSIFEEVNMVKEISIKSSSKFDATGPLGIEASLEHTGQVEISTEEISGDSNLKGTFVTGPVSGGVSLTQSLALFPFRPKARIQSDLKVDSTLLQAQNTFTTTYANGELSVLSNTDAFGDVLTHTAEVTIRKSTFAVKSDAKALALGLKIQNIAEVSVSAGDVNIKFETTTDHPEDYIRSLITATLNADGLAVNSNAAVKLAEHTATHKASLALNKNGLATNGTTFLNSPLVLKNTFSGISYADLIATAKCSTTAKLMGAHMSHDTEMEIAGLGVRINNNANFNSQPVRFTTTLQATAVPFSFNLNALANGDGELNLFGKQSAQVYTKFLLKAEPLAFAHSHECRVSTKHELNSDVIIETNFDKKVDTVLTPFEQLATIRVKSKINNNEISQDVSAYNNPERIGVEASGVFISGEIQDVSLSGFLKYEKNTESHAINLPFIESLPEVLENIKITAVTIAEDLQNYIQREDFIVEIQTLLQHISDFVTDLNLEERIIQLKNDLITFAQDCPITVEHLEASGIMKEIVANGDVQKLTEKLKVLTEEFDINTVLLYALNVPLPLPKIQLPKIPTAVVVPTFGKLYSEIRLRTPIYTLRTSAEIQNSTGNEQMHHFTAFLTSIGESSEYPVLNYNLDCTARIGVPRMSRLIIAETLKFIHSALTVEHQASVTFYVEGGMSASLDTTYKHKVDIPFLSMTNEATLTQSAVAIQKDTTISVTVGQIGTGKVNLPDYSEEASYKSDLRYTMDLQNVKFTFTEDFDSATLKIKDTLNVNAVMLSHIDFNGQIETKSSYIKNSLLVASGRAHLGDRKVELEATHDTELVGPLSGTLSNALNIMVRPVEIVIDFQNKGNTKITLIKSLSAKIDLQNDYSVIVNSRTQRINTAALVRFNQYKYGYNFTIDNKESESGIYATANGETDLEFLTVPLSIPEIPVPMLDFSIPAISDLNLYEHSGLKHLLITTKQAIDVDGKIVYQKSKFPPIIDLGFISVPAIGNLNSEVSFKSSIFNLNANAGIHGDDLVIRVAATSTSVHKPLKAKLEGTSGLTLKRGVKLATTVSLENAHFSGNHDSTLTLNTENLEAAVAVSTFAKTKLPILTIDANHNFKTDTKTHLKAESILDIKYTYDLPIIKAVGKGDAEHTFKLDGAFSSISVESTAKGKIDGTLLQAGIVNGALDNGASIYMDSRGLRSNLKTDGNIYVNYADLKVEFDVNENLDMEAALARVYTVLNIASNNEVNIAALNTKGKHAVKATIDLAPLTADVEFDLSQPSNFGDLTMYEKTVVDLPKGMISYSTKIVSPIYTTNTAIEVEGDAPVFKVALKSYAISPFVLLGYNLDSKYLFFSTDPFIVSHVYVSK
uniref:Vitellogenin domain-containing protein n=1 Tax=Pygocentrus nattereri TaxID=42514 RepID=A0A3B4E7Y6_PYGNA